MSHIYGIVALVFFAVPLCVGTYFYIQNEAAKIPEVEAVETARFEQRLESLSRSLERTEIRLASAIEGQGRMQAEIAGIERRLARTESLPRAAAVETADVAPESVSTPGGSASPGDSPKPSEDLPGFRVLLGKVVNTATGKTATPEEEQRFWELARTTGMVDDLIRALEEEVEAGPRDVAALMNLADAYVAKLLTVPAGPERGLWGMRAEAQWRKVLETDPNHWDARFSLAYGHARYPDFMNMTGKAIRGFEQALEIQESRAPEPRFVTTYLELSRLYQKQGDPAKAREVLRRGMRLHPNHQAMLEALKKLKVRM
jgi:tetratricopeptide (TPR) repeat protein